MKFTFLKWALGTGVIAVLLSNVACTPADELPSSSYENGVFISCEGPFGNGTGSVFFYNRSVGGVSSADVFAKENNGAVVGNILQSMSTFNGKTFLVVNNANKILSVDPSTFKFLDSTGGLALPRYFLGINSTSAVKKAYISQWGSNGLEGSVAVYDFSTKSIARTVKTGKGAEKMLQVGTQVFVLNNGGFGTDSTVSILETTTDSIVRTLNVGAQPNSIVADANGDIWVLCGDYYDCTGTGKLVKIRNNAVERSFDVPKCAYGLITDKTGYNLYFIANNKVYTKDLFNFGANLPQIYMSQNYFTTLYALGFDGKTGHLYCADAKAYAPKGKVYIFNADAKTLHDSIAVGAIPNGFLFK